MGFGGKLLGAGLGFAIAGPLGAIVGGVMGHFMSDSPLADGRGTGAHGMSSDDRSEFYFVANLVAILAMMVKADGRVAPEEVQTVRRFFSDRLGYDPRSLTIIKEMLKRFLEEPIDLDEVCRDFRNRSDYEVRLLLAECLCEVAMADGDFHRAELALFDRVATILELTEEDKQRCRSMGRPHAGPAGTGPSLSPDHEVLGVSADATEGEIKSAYREMAKKYHPDRVAHLGEEFKELAHKKFLDVQNAYANMLRTRGG